MSTLPRLSDHDFARMLRAKCEDYSLSMAEIAAELGCTPQELCNWIFAYKEPKPHKTVDNSKYGPAIAPKPVVSINRAKAFAEYRRAAYAGAPTAGQRT